MLPTSLVIAIVTVAMTLVPALLLLWAWRAGLFRDLEGQARVIFEPRDWQLRRPWETAQDQLARELTFGDPVEPEAGEWGGATRGTAA